MVELSIVLEELGAAGCPLLMMVVSPAICGTVIGRFGTDEQKQRWLPGLADGSSTMAFAITEPDAGSNSHEITTVARRDGDEWVLSGQKVWISGVDQADALLVVGQLADGPKGTLRPALFVVPTDAPGLTAHRIPMEIVSPERQFQLFLDDVRLPADALVGHPDQGIAQLFAGLNPERVMAAAYSLGVARLAMRKATDYARERQVWGTPIGAHQGLAHPLAACQIEIECARLMTQKAAWLIDAGQDAGAGRQQRQVRRRRGRGARRRPGDPDPRRQRALPGVRRRRAAGDVPRQPDRPGQPRDDPQLRRPARPAAPPLLLTPSRALHGHKSPPDTRRTTTMSEPRIHTSEFPPVEIPATPIYETVLGQRRGSGATTRRWSTASPGRRSPTPSWRRWSTGWPPGSPRSACSPGDVVALHSPNTVLYPVVFYAASRAGATVTTLSALTTAKDMANQLDDSKATLVITVGALLPVAVEAAGDRPVWTCDLVEGHRSVQELLASTGPVPEVARRRRRGRRGAALLQRHHQPAQGRDAHPRQHRREPAADRRRCTRWRPDDRIIAVLPFFHIYGMTVLMNLPLQNGATVVVLPRFDLEQFLDGPRAAPDHPGLRGAAGRRSPSPSTRPSPGRDLSALTSIVSAAAPLDAELAGIAARAPGRADHARPTG